MRRSGTGGPCSSRITGTLAWPVVHIGDIARIAPDRPEQDQLKELEQTDRHTDRPGGEKRIPSSSSMAAAALWFAARRLCGRALRGPQARSFMSAARQILQPDIDGATKLRRLLASESTSIMNRPHGRLPKRVDVTKQELLRQSEGVVVAAESSSVAAAHNSEFFSSLQKSLAGTVAAIVATVYLEAKAIKAWNRRK